MQIWKYTYIFLLLVLAVIVVAILQMPDNNLHLIACNVGQGDAVLMVYKNIQVLTDGGPGSNVLDCLGKYLPFYDREIELVILTHPDKDHFAGLIDVFRRYKVDNYLYNPITVSKEDYKVLEKEVGSRGVTRLNSIEVRQMRLDLIYLDVLNPSEQFLVTNFQFLKEKEVPDSETNAYSIVSLVSFGKFKALLTGDMPPEVSDSLAANWSFGSINYIKVPHHGSKNGLTENLLKTLMPKLAVISVGAKNRWGFPSPEILKMLSNRNIKVLRTDEKGDVETVTDGDKYWLKD